MLQPGPQYLVPLVIVTNKAIIKAHGGEQGKIIFSPTASTRFIYLPTAPPPPPPPPRPDPNPNPDPRAPMDFFSSVFSAPAPAPTAEQGDEEEEQEKQEDEQEAAAEAGEEEEAEESGGGWIFGGLIKTLKEEIEEQRKEQEAAAAAEEAQRGAAADGEREADTGGGWIFGGLIKTLAEEIEAQRKEQEAASAAEEGERGAEAEAEAEAEAADGDEFEEGKVEGSGGGWSFGGLIKTLAEEIESQRKENESAAAAEEEEGERGAEAETAAADEGEGSGGGWGFGGLIKTLAEEIESQRKDNESAAAAEEEGERGAEEETTAADEGEGDGEGSDGGWSFGGLVKTFASRSESVIGGYRRDLQDLGSGLRLETAALRAAAARAAAVLPGALEAGASAASDRLESVGQAVDDLGATAAVLLSHANEALRSAEADGEGVDGGSRPSDTAASGASWRASLSSKKYTRFEAQVLALRADPTTFTEEPEDVEGFARWRVLFSIDEMREQIEGVLRESPGLVSFVERLVPSVVDNETFWCRYFFAVNKLKQAEDVRTKLVSRAMSKEDDEELSWDIDDEDDDNNVGDHKEDTYSMAKKKEEQIEEPVNRKPEGSGKQEAVAENDSAEDKETDLTAAKDGNGESNGETATPKSSDGLGREEKAEAGDSSKESDFSVVSQPSAQEEYLSWEEIENVSDQDEKKGANPQSSSASKVEVLQKRLNSVEDNEDLSWDVDE
ncbi:uncharacterized protein LOC133909888 [Phragmites australis]|uniref:uncharacterized protein LOC133909888 n=1 Tax=Phragmites australis TaxID=29695 RepID=UPI002D76C390|nr:uncharacterized protein LOC133909888 [Phragmites australis]